MAKFWFKVGILAACLAAVVMMKIYLTDVARSGFGDSDARDLPALEVETQAASTSGKPAGH